MYQMSSESEGTKMSFQIVSKMLWNKDQNWTNWLFGTQTIEVIIPVTLKINKLILSAKKRNGIVRKNGKKEIGTVKNWKEEKWTK